MSKQFLRRFSDPKWLIQILSFMALAALAAGYYFWYVPQKQKYFAGRNFRVLALKSEQIRTTIEAMPGALKIAAQSVEYQPEDLTNRLIRAMELIPALTLMDTPKVEPATRGSTNVSINIRSETGKYWVEYEYRGHAGKNTNRVVTIRARGDLNQIAGPPREFDGLLIAEEKTGEILFQKLPAGLTVQRLNKPAEEQPSPAGTNFVQLGSRLMTVPLAGDNYKFFVQPLHIAAPLQEAATNNWLVCGMVRASRFKHESLELPYIYLIIFIFLAMFAVFSLAFPKVGFAGPTEALRRRHVILLGIGTLGGAALLTVLLLVIVIYPRMEDRLDDRLENLAGSICTHFTSEVEQLHAVLGRLDELKSKPSMQASNEVTDILKAPNIAKEIEAKQARFDTAFWIRSNGTQSAKWTVRQVAAPLIDVRGRAYFQDALNDRASVFAYRSKGTNRFWLEPIYSLSTGNNSVALSVRGKAGPVAVIESRLQSLIRPVLPAVYGFCVVTEDGRVLFHSDEQRNLRENIFEECDEAPALRSAILSRASKDLEASYLGRTHHMFVRPIANLPWSLVAFRAEQALSAANFEVVLVCLSMLVLYFLTPAAVALLVWGLPWAINWAMGRPTRLSALPRGLWPDYRHRKEYWLLSSFNFFLAVLLIGVLSLFIRSPGWTLAFAGAAVLVWTLVAFRLLRAARPQQPPPSEPRKPKVLDLITDRLIGWICTALPKWLKTPLERHAYQWGYVAALISLIVWIAVIPAFVCFKIALDQRIELSAKHAQFKFAKAVGDRAERLTSEYRLGQLGTNTLDSYLKLNSTNLPCDVYAGRELGIEVDDKGASDVKPGGTRLRSRFHWLFDKITPLHSPASVEARALLEKRAEDGSWQSYDDPKQGLVFFVNNYRKNASLRVSTQTSDSLGTGELAAVGLLVLVLMGVALLFPVCFLAGRVFLVEVKPQLVSSPDTQEPGPVPDSQSPKAIQPSEFPGIWARCSEDERFALFYVAKHGVIHAANPGLPGLLGKRLLVRSPALALAGGDKFKDFVLKSIPPEKARTYSRPVAGKGWDLIQGPMYVALVAVAFFLFSTQPDVYKIAIGAITGFAAGPGAILKLLSLFEDGKAKDDNKPDKPE
jgi:hypothetical protein